MPLRKCLCLCVLAVLAGTVPTAAETLTYSDLLDMMVDLKGLARRPHPEEFCRQASSYDRRTRWDEETRTIVARANNAPAVA